MDFGYAGEKPLFKDMNLQINRVIVYVSWGPTVQEKPLY
jgi:hypothetical protein